MVRLSIPNRSGDMQSAAEILKVLDSYVDAKVEHLLAGRPDESKSEKRLSHAERELLAVVMLLTHESVQDQERPPCSATDPCPIV